MSVLEQSLTIVIPQTTVAARKAHEAVVACQARIEIYPAKKLRIFFSLPGVRRATKWYCPPAVGYMLASSPSEYAVASVPKKTRM